MKKQVQVKVEHWSIQGKYIKNRLQFDRSMAEQIKTFEAIQLMSKMGEQ